VAMKGVMDNGLHQDVVLVNRERISKTKPLAVGSMFLTDTAPPAVETNAPA